MNLIAHRGNNNHNYAENTLEGILDSLSKPYIVGIEMDIRLTKDKKVVVVHDYTINRVSDGMGIVSRMTLKKLKNFNFGNKYHYSKIKTLDEILKKLKTDKIIVIEVKIEFGDYKRFARQIIKIVKKYYNLNIILASFNSKLIDFLKENTKHKVGIGHITDYKFDFSLYDAYFIRYNYFKNQKINKMIFYWTVNNKEFINKYKEQLKNNIYIITDKAYLLK